jgi:predicted HAD superfamily Cof-like phosphohydrolase
MDYRQPLVADFMTTVKQWDGTSVLSHPKPKDEKELATYKLRLKLTLEETFEVFEAVLSKDKYEELFAPVINDINTKISNLTMEDMEINPVELLDSLTDQDVVNVGWANIMGFDLQASFKEVHRSNMTKLDANGQPIFREDGKLLKSHLYEAPDLAKVYAETSFDYNATPKTVTLESLKAKVKEQHYHVVPGTTVTLCTLVLENGFAVTGESACASPELFDEELGKRLAYQRAIEKVWPLEGYLLKEQLSD